MSSNKIAAILTPTTATWLSLSLGLILPFGLWWMELPVPIPYFPQIVAIVGLVLAYLGINRRIKGAAYGLISIVVIYGLNTLLSLAGVIGWYMRTDEFKYYDNALISVVITGMLLYGVSQFLRELSKENPQNTNTQTQENSESGAIQSEALSNKEWLPALLLCFFFGPIGIHRFYVGKIGTGILMIFTLGGLGIWAIVDFITIIIGSFKDANGRVIKTQKVT